MFPLALMFTLSAQPPERMAVIARVISEGGEEVADVDVEATALKRAGYLIGVTPLSRAELIAGTSGGLDDQLRACGANAQCVQQTLVSGQIRWGLVAIVNLTQNPVTAAVMLLDTQTSTRTVSHFGELPYARSELLPALDTFLFQIFDAANLVTGGRVTLQPNPPNATLFRNEAPLSNPALLPPGRHTLTLQAPKHVATSTTVWVAPGAELKIPIRLAEEFNLVESPWFWGAVAVAVVGSALLTWQLTRQPDPYLLQTPPR